MGADHVGLFEGVHPHPVRGRGLPVESPALGRGDHYAIADRCDFEALRSRQGRLACASAHSPRCLTLAAFVGRVQDAHAAVIRAARPQSALTQRGITMNALALIGASFSVPFFATFAGRKDEE